MHRGWKVTGNMFFTEKQRKTRAAIQSISSRRCQALEFVSAPYVGFQAEASPNTQSGGNRWCV